MIHHKGTTFLSKEKMFRQKKWISQNRPGFSVNAISSMYMSRFIYLSLQRYFFYFIEQNISQENGSFRTVPSFPKTGEMTFDSEAWYTLDGVRLSGKPSTKGIYINNGKKIVIK